MPFNEEKFISFYESIWTDKKEQWEPQTVVYNGPYVVTFSTAEIVFYLLLSVYNWHLLLLITYVDFFLGIARLLQLLYMMIDKHILRIVVYFSTERKWGWCERDNNVLQDSYRDMHWYLSDRHDQNVMRFKYICPEQTHNDIVYFICLVVRIKG